MKTLLKQSFKKYLILIFLVLGFLSMTSLQSQPYLWSVTESGGTNGAGTIFSFDPTTATLTVKKEFGSTDGVKPYGGLLRATNGKLYGTTFNGGTDDYGVVYKYNPVFNTFNVIANFIKTNGKNPKGLLIQASNGMIYGMTQDGGLSNNGVIFKIDPTTEMLSVVHQFVNSTGYDPNGSLIQASDGFLYGMTKSGGTGGGSGVIFKFDTGTDTYTYIHGFDGTNGGLPLGSLVQASDGLLYGLTSRGGTNDEGVVFKYATTTSTFTKIYDLDETSGRRPAGNLIEASDGLFYGMTLNGGSTTAGTIFKTTGAVGNFTVVHDFQAANGKNPKGTLFEASDGIIYGMANQGGAHSDGVIFKLVTSTGSFTNIYDFDGPPASKDPNFNSFIEIDPASLSCPNFVVKFFNSNGDPMAGGSLEYREGGGNPWQSALQLADGLFCIDTDRSQVGLRMTYGPQIQKIGGVPTNTGFTFQAANVTVALEDNGTPVDGGEVDYTSDGWHAFGTTGDDGANSGSVSKEMLPVQYTFRMKYSGDKENKTEVISGGNNLITFEVADLKSSESDDRDEFQLTTYPNPFNGNATITFSLEEAQNIKISVYDQTGRLIVVLQDGIQSEGNHKIVWDASGVTKGVYFVRLSSNGKIVHQNVVKM